MRYITKAEFSELAGVTTAAIAKACRLPKGSLCDALTRTGKIDRSHSKARAYVAKHSGEMVPKDSPAPIEGPERSQDVLDWTLRQIASYFGNSKQFGDWVTNRGKLAKLREVEIKNQRALGKLVSRETVRSFIFEPISGVHKKILTDGAKSIAAEALIMAQAGEDQFQIQKAVTDILSSFLVPARDQMARSLEKMGEK